MRVLFVCVHNSARSQMAMSYLNKLGGGQFQAESAGLEPGSLNPLVVEVMGEEGYDIAGNPVNSVFDYYRQGRQYDLVIKVCEQSAGQKCPIFPGARWQLTWDFADPAAFSGSREERLARTRQVRDAIRRRVEAFIQVFGADAAPGGGGQGSV